MPVVVPSARIDRFRKRRPEVRRVVLTIREFKLVKPFAFHGYTNKPTGFFRHEIDFFGSAALGGKGQVAFIFPVFIVNDDNEVSLPVFVDSRFNRFKRIQNPDLSKRLKSEPLPAGACG